MLNERVFTLSEYLLLTTKTKFLTLRSYNFKYGRKRFLCEIVSVIGIV